MCCFSGKVTFVGNTRIFARMVAAGQQGLVYQMKVGAPADVAMILPIPVIAGSAEESVKFLDLSGYPKFFDDLQAGFPEAQNNYRSLSGATAAPAKALKVLEVGSYEASYVPKVADFARLDARFRLPVAVWKKLPQFADYGFAVFRLKSGEREIHPMGFTFPTRHAAQLFFPTVHIHDGALHREEKFDHTLYCQTRLGGRAMLDWAESARLAGGFTKPKLAKKLFAEDQHVHRRSLQGKMRNEDILLASA